MAGRVDHHKQALFDHAHHLVTPLAVAASGVGRHDSIGIKKHPGCVGEVKPTLYKALLTFTLVPFEIHVVSVAQWTTPSRLNIVH